MLDKATLKSYYQAMIAHGPRNEALEQLIDGIQANECVISVQMQALHLLMAYETERRQNESTDDISCWILNKTINLICGQTEEDEMLENPETIFRRSLMASQSMLETVRWTRQSR